MRKRSLVLFLTLGYNNFFVRFQTSHVAQSSTTKFSFIQEIFTAFKRKVVKIFIEPR